MEKDATPYASFRTNATSSDTPNPLRPYYKPPSTGLPPDPAPQGNASSASGRYPARPPTPPRPRASSLRSSARDYLPDFDYADYLPERSPSMAETAKSLLDQALWNYTSVLLAQPFEVAKTVLQVQMAAGGPGIVRPTAQAHRGAGSRMRSDAYAKGFQDVRGYRNSGRASPILLRSDTGRGLTRREQESYYDVEDDEALSDESDGDSPSYFTSAAPRVDSTTYGRSSHYPATPSRSQHGSSHYNDHRSSRHAPSRSHSTTPTQNSMPHSPRKDSKLALKRPDAVLEAISQLWQKEAAWGVWKGTNATFVYNVLLRTIESWIRSLLAALMNLPEGSMVAVGSGAAGLASSAGGSLAGPNILDSPSPLASLGVAVAAAGLTGLILSPLDIVRTRLIVTPTSSTPRAIFPSLRLLPNFSTLQNYLFPGTLLHSTLPSLFSNSAPLLLRSIFKLDPILTPTLYSIASFGAAVGELFVRLPLETVLRRGQVALLLQSETEDAPRLAQSKPRSKRASAADSEFDDSESEPSSRSRFVPPPPRSMETVVDVGPYRGVLGSMWYIIREEGTSVPSVVVAGAKQANPLLQRARRGQGVSGLWRGWRVGFWGLVGVWGAAALGTGGTGGEF